MNRIFYFVLLALQYSCTNGGNSSNGNAISELTLQNDTTNEIKYGIPEFLKLVDEKSLGFRGNFQGVEDTDSSGPYLFNEYFSDTLSFRLVYVPKSLNKKDITFESIAKAKNNDFKDFLLLSFVYPMKNPDNVINDDDQIKYPLAVTTYVKKEKKWELLSKSTVNNLTELSEYQINCIYSALD